MKNAIFIYSLGLKGSLAIQTIPKDVEYKIDSNFEAIASPGRNNPIYHYTGSEDTITMELDWYSDGDDINRTKVIESCRWLEGHTKANGYNNAPSPVLLIWGSSLFSKSSGAMGETWLIVDASYRMGPFSRPHDLLPVQAYQTLTLKRITSSNRLMRDIMLVSPPDIAGASENPDNLMEVKGSYSELAQSQGGLVFNQEAQLAFQQKVEFNPATQLSQEAINKDKIPKFMFGTPKSELRKFAESRGKELGKSAANFFANQVIYSGVSIASQVVSVPTNIISSIPQLGGKQGAANANIPNALKFSNLQIGKDIIIPDYLK